MVEYIPQLQVADSFGRTPLHFAAQIGHMDIVKMLIIVNNKSRLEIQLKILHLSAQLVLLATIQTEFSMFPALEIQLKF